MTEEDIQTVFYRVLIEQSQGHETRQHLFIELEKKLGRPVISFFTSFSMPVMIDDSDVGLLEGILQEVNLENGLVLILSSPGGQTLAAERIINVCRSYSGTGDYWVVVPNKAKSAATLICFGASKVFMAQNSELGPVDPQLVIEREGEAPQRFSVYNVVHSYDSLFERAVAETGRIEPYLQQLEHYDEREVSEMRAALELSEDISIRTLKSGMMSAQDEETIKKKIGVFLTPEYTKTHGRPIFRAEAKGCDLEVEEVDVKDDLWKLVFELWVRTDNFVSTRVAKCFESKDVSFAHP
jgi:hypothetical protein